MVAGSEDENKGQGEEGGGEGQGSWREGKEKERQKDESVGEMMGIKREMGQDNPGPR